MGNEPKPPLLLVTAVLPFPGAAGQQQRVRNKLIGFRPSFHITVLTYAPRHRIEDVRRQLLELADEAIVLPARYDPTASLSRWLYKLVGTAWAWLMGLKFSNYLVGRLELSPARVRAAVGSTPFAVVVYEYWHAFRSALALKPAVPVTVLDMHDILWRSRDRQLRLGSHPAWLRRTLVRRYRRHEESAWAAFDVLISINREEHRYVERLFPSKPILHAPMGAELSRWSYGPEPAEPPRLAYYGGLASLHNQQDAMVCAREIMPRIWARHPEAELWIIGSNPPGSLLELPSQDPRFHVTGFVDDAASLLRQATAVLCPWEGEYGFRSRLVEVMALGVPVVASPAAVSGMELPHGQGIFLEPGPEAMAAAALRLLESRDLLAEQQRRARHTVEKHYSFEATYGRLSRELRDLLQTPVDGTRTAGNQP